MAAKSAAPSRACSGQEFFPADTHQIKRAEEVSIGSFNVICGRAYSITSQFKTSTIGTLSTAAVSRRLADPTAAVLLAITAPPHRAMKLGPERHGILASQDFGSGSSPRTTRRNRGISSSCSRQDMLGTWHGIWGPITEHREGSAGSQGLHRQLSGLADEGRARLGIRERRRTSGGTGLGIPCLAPAVGTRSDWWRKRDQPRVESSLQMPPALARLSLGNLDPARKPPRGGGESPPRRRE